MSTTNTAYSPNTLEAAIAHLRASEAAHLEALKHATLADDTALFATDIIMYGVAQRSLMLIDGFTTMVEQSNHVCGIPLLRLQLDNIMRFHALWLVSEPQTVLQALLVDTPFNKLKSHDGQPLTDAYLHKQLSKLHPWVSEVYKRTSGFIHLSTPGILSSVTQVGDADNHTVQVYVGSKAGRKWSDSEKKEAVDAFIAATDALLHLFVSWAVTKERCAQQRTEAQDNSSEDSRDK